MKLYKYFGTVSVMESCGKAAKSIVLKEIRNDEKAPVRLSVCGALAEYIYNVGMTDVEERHLSAYWYYDHSLYLRRVEILSRSILIPAKVITQDEHRHDELLIFGPKDYIETSNPAPMNRESFEKWMQWKSEHTQIVKKKEASWTT